MTTDRAKHNEAAPLSHDDLVSAAIRLARQAHHGQTRRGGCAYIPHPYHVAERVAKAGPVARAVAWLHDTMETDAAHPLTEDDLRAAAIPEDVIRRVKLLTKSPNMSYTEYLLALADDPVACRVKVADMLDNLSDDPTPRQIEKYAKGLLLLMRHNPYNEPTPHHE